jgi:hypothetical protein
MAPVVGKLPALPETILKRRKREVENWAKKAVNSKVMLEVVLQPI